MNTLFKYLTLSTFILGVTYANERSTISSDLVAKTGGTAFVFQDIELVSAEFHEFSSVLTGEINESGVVIGPIKITNDGAINFAPEIDEKTFYKNGMYLYSYNIVTDDDTLYTVLTCCKTDGLTAVPDMPETSMPRFYTIHSLIYPEYRWYELDPQPTVGTELFQFNVIQGIPNNLPGTSSHVEQKYDTDEKKVTTIVRFPMLKYERSEVVRMKHKDEQNSELIGKSSFEVTPNLLDSRILTIKFKDEKGEIHDLKTDPNFAAIYSQEDLEEFLRKYGLYPQIAEYAGDQLSDDVEETLANPNKIVNILENVVIKLVNNLLTSKLTSEAEVEILITTDGEIEITSNIEELNGTISFFSDVVVNSDTGDWAVGKNVKAIFNGNVGGKTDSIVLQVDGAASFNREISHTINMIVRGEVDL